MTQNKLYTKINKQKMIDPMKYIIPDASAGKSNSPSVSSSYIFGSCKFWINLEFKAEFLEFKNVFLSKRPPKVALRAAFTS